MERSLKVVDGKLDISWMRLEVFPPHIDPLTIKWLDCEGNRLEWLPDLPLAERLNCSRNKLASLPSVPSAVFLYCEFNQLESLPDIPMVKFMACSGNKLKSLPRLPLVKYLKCNNNGLKILPEMPEVELLECKGNPLLYDPKHNRLIWKIRRLIWAKVVRRWRTHTRRSIAKKLLPLHTELLYSPDLPFYRSTPEAQHWFESVAQELPG